MRVVTLVILFALLVFVSRELALFFQEKKELAQELSRINSEVERLANENEVLERDKAYYADEDNLEKEARSELNYKAPGEKLIIVVPARQ